jgi:hypothetical protein
MKRSNWKWNILFVNAPYWLGYRVLRWLDRKANEEYLLNTYGTKNVS